MKRILLSFLLSCFASFLWAQPYENSWINNSQPYYKIKISQEGIYRINQQTLLFAGVQVTGSDPRKIQLFHNGIEQYIYIEGENDGQFNPSDFIEFYGEKNDGNLDSKLYADPSWQPTPSYSLFTDTSVYFLTISNSTNGKRLTQVNDNNYAAYSPAPYFIKESYQDPATQSQSGRYVGYNRGMSGSSIEYTESEGWCDVFGNYQASNYPLTINVNTDKMYSSGPNVEITTCVGGVNNNPHNISITFPGANFTDTYYSQSLRVYPFSISPAVFTASTTPFIYNVTTPLSVSLAEFSAFYWLSVRYPHTYDLEGRNTFKMFVPDDAAQSKTLMNITNFNPAASPVMYDITNHKRILVSQSGSNFQALVPNDGNSSPKVCYISTQAAIQNITAVSGINYVSNNFGFFNNLQSIARDSAFIIIAPRSLWNQAQSYKAYRDQTTGNRTVLLDIDELYDQFAYGIQKHPLSIKNFIHYALNSWTGGPPQNLLLLGKSISGADFRNNPGLFGLCMVPSFGVPTSDQLLTSGIDGSLYEPKVPVGRISARTGTDVTDYLAKVQEYEDAQAGQPQPWMKEILHFGGGDDINQQALLASYLDAFKNVMEDSLFGGHVTTYLKYNSNPIVINQSDSLQAQIDSGVAVMTFFGHASGSGFDQSTDEPSAYNNQGRYPVVIANSCFAGDFHAYQKSVSEKFVLEPRKAAIAFIASVGQGIPQDLFNYSNAFFENASYYSYGATIGQLMKKAVETIQLPNQENLKIVCNEMSLQGDPSLRLNYFVKPDYAVNESNISFSPEEISTDLDTFTVHVTLRNIGKAVQDSFYVNVIRSFPDGVDSVFTLKRGRCYYQDTINITMKTGGFSAAGVNRVRVEIDLPDSVAEYNDYSNNFTSTNVFIKSNDIIPVYPAKFAIHPYSTVTLKASTADPLADIKNYRFEIDTVDLNIVDSTPGMQPSPMFRFTVISDSGGVLSWTPPGITLQDSTVYFWRVANDSIFDDPAKFQWQQSSFMYINGKTGWAQSHFYQFKDNTYENIFYDTTNRKFDFVRNNKSLRVFTHGTPDGSQTQYNEIGYFMNNAPIEYNGCQPTPAILIAVLDSITLDPWGTCEYNFGQANPWVVTSGVCGDPTMQGINVCQFPGGRQRPENYFIFRYNDPAQMQNLQSMLNQVPNGNYILAYSWYTYPYSTADASFNTSLSALGFNMTMLQDNAPFILLTKKGYPSTIEEEWGQIATDDLQLQTLLSAVWNRGYTNSEIIGPSTHWDSFHWNQVPDENPSRDQVYVNVFGLNDVSKNWDTLVTGLSYSVTGKDTVLNWINATTYPYLKLQTFVQDDSLRTPAQMKYWRLYFDDVPECALNPNRSFGFYTNPIQEGDTVRMHIAIDNIGNLPMDSLDVSFYLYDNNRVRHNLQNVKLDSLREGQSLRADVVVDHTFGLAGSNGLWIEANPFNATHQLEKYHFNNLMEMKFTMNRDMINPILDVTFDGVHILDGDIVSGKPTITIQLHDENKFLALNDTAKFKVYLKSPNSQTQTPVFFSFPTFGNTMRFTPAVLPKNSCKIEWNPSFETDGIYVLEVEATDKSNNESGKYNYKISFEVVNKSTITEFLNYPNPFSTSTRFVFTLTGNEIPSHMKIQIMTVTGKIVREIMQNELGNIHIGRNITDYAWDGKDEYGDQLANGLYLYRVVTDLHGETIEHRATDADKFFKKGWGKMYLMR
ncbi:MAG TPA: C25 family cysteine peptidase [Bacteroidia bacterium]|nr:C25 family cysteine peptidase [Bacteroidia bacterium]